MSRGMSRQTPEKYKRTYVTIAQLKAKGVDTKICHHCKDPMRLRKAYNDNIPGVLLFINKQKDIYVLLHRKCKPIYTAGLRK